MGRSPRPISTLQEVTSEDEDRDRPQEAPRAVTPHFLSPQPAPRQRSFSCTQHALQQRHGPPPEPNYVIVTPPTAAGEESAHAAAIRAGLESAAANRAGLEIAHATANRMGLVEAEYANPATSPAHIEQKSRERPQSHGDATQTAL